MESSDKRVSALSHGFGGEGVPGARSNNGRTSGPTRRSTKGQWTPEEDEILCQAVQKFKGKNWKKIAECFKDRSDVQCLHRWQKVLNPDLIKGPWSKEEDEQIIQLVNKYGPKKWSLIAQQLPGRIGKQCRERWHNHLNPAINKEAWTQEEELILIRAHQTYGNRWAELTKFLPGRSDNAIKNHWNSSVRKKLDSYSTSGLLSQLPPLPMPQNQPMPPSSSRKRNNGYGSGPSGAEAEERSECSLESAIVACSQSGSEMTNSGLEVKEEMHWTEEYGSGTEQSLSLMSYIGQYYPLDDVNLSIPERPCEVGCSSKYLEQKISNNVESSASRICPFDMHQLPDISSLQLGFESSGFPMQCSDMNGNQESTNNLFQTSGGLFSKSLEAMALGSDKLDHTCMSDDEFCRFLFSGGGSSYSDIQRDTNMVDLEGCSDSLLCRSAIIQNSESYGVSEPAVLGTCHQLCQPAPLLSNDDNALISNRVSEDLHENHGEENTSMPHDIISNNNNCANSSHDGRADSTSMQKQLDVINDPLMLVPANSISPRLDKVHTCCSADDNPDATTEQQEGGFLCYEPPRFPSLDIPVFSCDLIQPGGEVQQDYSPLGIRKLMSYMDCISPFKLWDSPSRDDSSKAMLKSAAKTFKGTPSILKKRNRDLLSPLSDRRTDKKRETDLTQKISRVDVMFDENRSYRKSRLPPASPLRRISEILTEEKENFCHPVEVGNDNARDGSASLISGRLLEKDFENCDILKNRKQGTIDNCGKGQLDSDSAVHAVQKLYEVIMEHDVNDLQLRAPDKVSSSTIGAMTYGTPKSPLCQNSLVLSKQSDKVPETSSGNFCHLPGSSSRLCGKMHDQNSVAVASNCAISTSAPLDIRVDNSRKETWPEGSSIFGDTPFKRGIESPSAWKSPWFLNPFLSCPGIEDIDYFISPENRSYDAIGLMQQINEHTAATYAEAQEVLGNETPETISKGRCFHNQTLRLEEEHSPRNCSNLAPKFQAESRMLDFSDCGSPVKGAELEKSPPSLAYSSPSSYLLKACR